MNARFNAHVEDLQRMQVGPIGPHLPSFAALVSQQGYCNVTGWLKVRLVVKRCVPLRKEVALALRHWLKERNGQPADAVFTNARGECLTRDGVQYILAQHVSRARSKCPSLKSKRVSPHVLRHSTAMNLLQHRVDRSVIALWLGHESMDTTQIYLHANLELKEKALAKTTPFQGRAMRYRPPDQLMAFLQAL